MVLPLEMRRQPRAQVELSTHISGAILGEARGPNSAQPSWKHLLDLLLSITN